MVVAAVVVVACRASGWEARNWPFGGLLRLISWAQLNLSESVGVFKAGAAIKSAQSAVKIKDLINLKACCYCVMLCANSCLPGLTRGAIVAAGNDSWSCRVEFCKEITLFHK